MKVPNHLPWSRRGHLLSSQGLGFRVGRNPNPDYRTLVLNLGFGLRVSDFGCRFSADTRCARSRSAAPLPPCASRFGFRISGFGFLVSDFGFRVQGCVFRFSRSGFRDQGFVFRISGFGFWGLGSEFGIRDSGFGLRVQGSWGLRVAEEIRTLLSTPLQQRQLSEAEAGAALDREEAVRCSHVARTLEVSALGFRVQGPGFRG